MSWLETWAMIQVVGFIIPFVIIVGSLFYFIITDFVRQSRCKHENYRENRACQAICSKCGKDLGFIDTVRKERAANNT